MLNATRDVSVRGDTLGPRRIRNRVVLYFYFHVVFVCFLSFHVNFAPSLFPLALKGKHVSLYHPRSNAIISYLFVTRDEGVFVNSKVFYINKFVMCDR